jgi:F-box domain
MSLPDINGSRNATFLDLNFDIHSNILEFLCQSSYWTSHETYFRSKRSLIPLLALSRVCKHLRNLTAPLLFESMRWPRPKVPSRGPSSQKDTDAHSISLETQLASMTLIETLTKDFSNSDPFLPQNILPHIK